MTALAVAIVAVAVVGLHAAILNQAFARCPHCRKIGAWRFSDLAPAAEELDDDGNVVSSTRRQRCRRCGGVVVHTWSDRDGRAILRAGE